SGAPARLRPPRRQDARWVTTPASSSDHGTVDVGFADPGVPGRRLAQDPRAGRGQVGVLATALGEQLHDLIAAVAPRRAAHDDLAGDRGHARGYHERSEERRVGTVS